MINFKEELLKYGPILEIDDIEEAIHSNELQDMFDMLAHIAKNDSMNEQTAYDNRLDKE